MITKEEVMAILDLKNADYDTKEGLSELQRRVEQVYGRFTDDKIKKVVEGLSDTDTVKVLEDIDAIIDAKRDILKNAECELKPTPWSEIEEVNREWLIPNWLPANTVTMFTGQGGAGKSWLTLQVICEIASHASGRSMGETQRRDTETVRIRRLYRE